MTFCCNCKHWKPNPYWVEDFEKNGYYSDYATGDCNEIRLALEFEVNAGRDGGYVEAVETEADFGCVRFEKKED